MRIFEFAMVLSLLVVIVKAYRLEPSKALFLYVLPVLFITLHLVFEGYRWQMLLIYGLFLIGYMKFFVDLSGQKDKKPLKKRTVGVSVLVLLVSVFLLVIFPVKTFNAPIGPHQVGTLSYDLTDTERIEVYGARKGDARKIRIQLWYPTDLDAKGKQAMWIEDGNVVPRGLMKVYGMPYFVMDHVTLIKTHSLIDAPLLSGDEALPVIVLSHGWTGFRSLHSDLGEMFASLGYLVVGIDHTYGSVGLVFDDGQVAPGDPSALPERGSDPDFDSYASQLVATYAADTAFVLDHLEALDTGGVSPMHLQFKNRIARDRIGVIGHSTGGGGVVKVALKDERVKAIVGYDPWVEPIGNDMLDEGLSQAALFFRSSSWVGGINEDFVKRLVINQDHPPQIVEIKGSRHQDFTAMYQFGPLPDWMGISGDLGGRKTAVIWQDFTRQFMNHHLKGEAIDLDTLINNNDSVFEVKHTH